jgi:hypothetical protein
LKKTVGSGAEIHLVAEGGGGKKSQKNPVAKRLAGFPGQFPCLGGFSGYSLQVLLRCVPCSVRAFRCYPGRGEVLHLKCLRTLEYAEFNIHPEKKGDLPCFSGMENAAIFHREPLANTPLRGVLSNRFFSGSASKKKRIEMCNRKMDFRPVQTLTMKSPLSGDLGGFVLFRFGILKKQKAYRIRYGSRICALSPF